MVDLGLPNHSNDKEGIVAGTRSLSELNGPQIERRSFLATVGGALCTIGGGALLYEPLRNYIFPQEIGTTDAEWGRIIAHAPLGTVRELSEIDRPVPGCTIFVMPQPNTPKIMDLSDAALVQRELREIIEEREQKRALNGEQTETDPGKSVAKGSGWIIDAKDRRYFVSNKHVLETCPNATIDPVNDVAIIPMSGVDGSLSQKTPVVAIDHVLSSPLRTGIKVEIVGWGQSVFEMTGTVIRAPGNNNRFHEEYFGIRLPDDFSSRSDEINGMSGSPVVEIGSGLIVGVLFSHVSVPDPATGKTHLVVLIEPAHHVFPLIERDLEWRRMVRELKDKLQREGGKPEDIEVIDKQLEEMGP